jgi:threonine synthase
MKFTSTRNSSLNVSFSKAVSECIPSDGGVFIPSNIEDLRRWIYYIDENTTFDSIAGTLTSAFLGDEFSPIICQTIATSAFSFSPVVRQLDNQLYIAELYHGFTGTHKDYGVSFLCSYLETVHELNGGSTVLLDFTHGGLGNILAKVLRGKKHVKAITVYQKGTVRGLENQDFVWNGGNIWPVEMEGSESEIKAKINKVFSDREFCQKNGLSVANTTNVCRFLAQMFFFPFAFSRVKNKVDGDIYYAMDSGNYGSLMAGLYSWRFALPVNGFFIPSTNALGADPRGNPVLLDSMVDLKKRGSANPAIPANLERLEAFFQNNQLMMKNFVFPCDVSEKQRETAAKELFIKYGTFADEATARAYSVVRERAQEVYDEDGAVVLVAYNHPAWSSEYCRHVLGETPEIPENLKNCLKGTEINRPLAKDENDLKNIVEKIREV